MLKECIEVYPYFLEARYWLAISGGYYWKDVRKSIEHLKVIINWTSTKPGKISNCCQCGNGCCRQSSNSSNQRHSSTNSTNHSGPLLDNRDYLFMMANIELFSIETRDSEAHVQMLTEELQKPGWSEDQIGEIYYFRAFVWDSLGNLKNALADMEESIARNYRYIFNILFPLHLHLPFSLSFMTTVSVFFF
jgi:hypothetical protein